MSALRTFVVMGLIFSSAYGIQSDDSGGIPPRFMYSDSFSTGLSDENSQLGKRSEKLQNDDKIDSSASNDDNIVKKQKNLSVKDEVSNRFITIDPYLNALAMQQPSSGLSGLGYADPFANSVPWNGYSPMNMADPLANQMPRMLNKFSGYSQLGYANSRLQTVNPLSGYSGMYSPGSLTVPTPQGLNPLSGYGGLSLPPSAMDVVQTLSDGLEVNPMVYPETPQPPMWMCGHVGNQALDPADPKAEVAKQLLWHFLSEPQTEIEQTPPIYISPQANYPYSNVPRIALPSLTNYQQGLGPGF